MMCRRMPPTAVGPVVPCPVQAAAGHRHTKPEKQWGETVDCYVAVLYANESIKEFKKKVGGVDEVIERFLHKNRVYFTGDVSPDMMMKLSIKRRMAFKKEVRRSRVLILSIKDKRTLSLEEACEIVRMSDLRYSMDRIDLVAVNPKTKKRNDKGQYNGMVHAYVQFLTEEDAERHVNVVDTMYYKGFYVHSPQCDEHSVFFPNDASADSYVWRNPDTCRSIPNSESEDESYGPEPDTSYLLRDLLNTPPPTPPHQPVQAPHFSQAMLPMFEF